MLFRPFIYLFTFYLPFYLLSAKCFSQKAPLFSFIPFFFFFNITWQSSNYRLGYFKDKPLPLVSLRLESVYHLVCYNARCWTPFCCHDCNVLGPACLDTQLISATPVRDSWHPRKVGWDFFPQEVPQEQQWTWDTGKCLSQNHTKKARTKLRLRYWFLRSQANTLHRGDLTELDSWSCISEDSLYSVLLKKITIGMRFHTVSVLFLTLRFARHDVRMVYPNKNPCWEYMLMLGSEWYAGLEKNRI